MFQNRKHPRLKVAVACSVSMVALRKVLNTITDDAARDAVTESTLLNFHHITRIFSAV